MSPQLELLRWLFSIRKVLTSSILLYELREMRSASFLVERLFEVYRCPRTVAVNALLIRSS
jgi:hypothetical protein